MKVMVTGHTTVVAMSVFKLVAGCLHVESRMNTSDHHAWQLITFLLYDASTSGQSRWCLELTTVLQAQMVRCPWR